MFAGFVTQESTIYGVLLALNTSDTPIDADAYPTFRVYGPDGYMVSGTCSYLDSGTITGATNANPVVITSVAHGLTTGARVTISSVLGNTAANTTAVATVLTPDTFSLTGVAGNGAYTSGGSWHATGSYRYSVPTLGSNGFVAGQVYDVLFNFAISTVAKGEVDSFCVV